MKWSILAFVAVCLTGILLFGDSWASAADTPAKEKADNKESLAQLRAYLPAIRCKALLENERQTVAQLKKFLALTRTFVEGGLVDSVQAGQVEEALLRARLRLLQRETHYHDSLDEFTQRSNISAERRQEMENATFLPLTNLIRRFETLSSDSEEVVKEALGLFRTEDVGKVRPALVKLLTMSALVKDTTLPKQFRKEWAEWQKLERIDEISDKLSKMRQEFLRREREGLRRGKQWKGKPEKAPLLDDGDQETDSGRAGGSGKRSRVPRRDDQNLEAQHFSCEVGSLEFDLRVYERQPWKSLIEQYDRLFRRHVQYTRVETAFRAVSKHAYNERFRSLCHSWPGLSPARVKEVDLIASEDSTAEEAVTRMLKSPNAQVKGKKKVRYLRTSAKSYRLEQELFVLAFKRQTEILDALLYPKRSPDVDQDGLIGFFDPDKARPAFNPFDAAKQIDAYRSLSQARRRLLQTWIDYQMVRLDLYHDLGVSPPDR